MKRGTHTGHCQACGRRQMVTPSGIAKHGYTVKGWGYFAGTCHGSGHKPLEIERTYTDEIIVKLGERARSMTTIANEYRGGKRIPLDVGTGKMLETGRDRYNRREWTEERIAWSTATVAQQAKEVERVVRAHEDDARRSRQHAEFLGKLADSVHGKALAPRAVKIAPRTFTEGERLKYYGEEYIVARIQGWSPRQQYVHLRRISDGREISPSVQRVRNHIS